MCPRFCPKVGVDEALVASAQKTEEHIVQLDNGCVCCTFREDLYKVLEALEDRRDSLDVQCLQ